LETERESICWGKPLNFDLTPRSGNEMKLCPTAVYQERPAQGADRSIHLPDEEERPTSNGVAALSGSATTAVGERSILE
jgi:hypothetical protein